MRIHFRKVYNDVSFLMYNLPTQPAYWSPASTRFQHCDRILIRCSTTSCDTQCVLQATTEIIYITRNGLYYQLLILTPNPKTLLYCTETDVRILRVGS